MPTSLISHQGSDESAPMSKIPSQNPALMHNPIYQATMLNHSALLPSYPVHKPSNLARTSTVAGVKQEGESTSLFSNQNFDVGDSYYQNTNGNNNQGIANRDEKGRKRTNFLSSAADLEYSTLSSILQDNFMALPNNLATSTEGTPNSVNLSPALSPHNLGGLHKVTSPSWLSNSFSAGQQEPQQHHVEARAEFNGHHDVLKYDNRINQYFLGSTSPSVPRTCFPEVIQAIESAKQADPAAFFAQNKVLTLSFTLGISPEEQAGIAGDDHLQFKEPEEIYAKITHPFSYTPGFHKLIAYLRNRFPKDMLVKMAKSMAVYRPSFIACTNSLREADLIFMEQCFQRTLLTYDKFLKVSGTPTIVWRRTGEIAYVGTEFTVLTGWTQEQLMGAKPMFIVEVLDDKSVVEYFELFSKIAFGDFLGATMTECTLLTPKKDVKIRAGCMWTLKRDVFGIPMMIIGNFLPIL